MRQAVILAGGKGSRLASRLNGVPKPLVDVDGVPLLERQLRELAAAGFTEAILLVSHGRAAIEAFCERTVIPGIDVKVRDDGALSRGTAGAVYEARAALADRFLVVYGDTLFDIDLERLWAAHEAGRAVGVEATLFLHPNDHPHDSDLVEMREGGRITAFHSKPHPPGACLRNLVNAALYVLEKSLVLDFPPGEGVIDYGRDQFPAMISAARRLHGYVTYEYIKDLGTPERLDRVVGDLRSGKVARARLSQPQKAVFIDRDGTLNRLAGHIATPEAFEVIEGAGKYLRKLNRAEYRCVLITNQPVIARGECTVEELERIHAKLETKLGEDGAFLDAIYYCPHHPHSGYAGEVAELKLVCDCRKPAPGLILRAAKDLSIDLDRSWFIGDSAADLGAARAAGVRSVLVRGGEATATSSNQAPDYEVDDLGDAARLILEGEAATRAALAPWLDAIRRGMLVKLSGQSRAGKSTLAATLRAALTDRGIAAVHVRLDHWTRPSEQRSKNGGVRGRYDLLGFEKGLALWSAGGALDLVAPRYDPRTRSSHPDGPRILLPPDGVLIIEGVLAFAVAPGARESLSLFVTAPETMRRERFMREYLRRGLTRPQARDLYLSRIRDEFAAVEDGRVGAHGIINAPVLDIYSHDY